MAKEQMEKVKELLEKAKVTAVIQDSALFGASISLPEIAKLIHQIDEIYMSREHELLTQYVSPDDTRKAMADERKRTLDDVEQLIEALSSYYKVGKTTEKAVVSRIKEDFNKLRTQE